MKRLRVALPLFLALAPLTYASDIGIDSVGVNIGYGEIFYKKEGSISVKNLPDKSYIHGELYSYIGGIFDDTTWKPSINYMLFSNSEFNHNILMVGINKYFIYDNYNFYAGALVGAGELKWKYNPLNSHKDYSTNLTSVVGALQVGSEYQLLDSLYLGVHAKYYMHNYKLFLHQNKQESSISHPNAYSISMGLRYAFATERENKERVALEPVAKSVVEPVIEEPVAETVLEPVVEEPVVEAIVEPVVEEPVVAPVVVDSDSDGVVDLEDRCPTTPQGFSVDKVGCEKAFMLEISFASSSSKIEQKYQAEVEKFALFLETFKNYDTHIEAHTDATGREKNNLILSTQRAKSVATALINMGVDSKRISYKGVGSAKPIASNKTQEGKEKNRRIEAILIKKDSE